MFFPPPFNLFCFCSVHTVSFLYCAHLWVKCSLDISSFPEEISSLSPSVVLFYFYALFMEESLLHAVLWNSAFSWMYLSLSPLHFTSLVSSRICKPLQMTTLPSCFSFSLGWFCSLSPVQYYGPPFIVLQAHC